MTLRHALATVVALGHLSLVVCGAAGVNLFPETPWLRGPLVYYGALSGADNAYGFFAPGVSSQWRVAAALEDATGQQWSLSPEEPPNREVDLRLGTSLVLVKTAGWRPYYTASWAAVMFGHYPDAEQITVQLDMYQVPTMVEYRSGQRPSWQFVYEATFICDSEGPYPQGE